MKCPICGKDVELQKKQVGVDEQGAPVFHQYAVCRDCKKQWDLDKQRTRKAVPDTAVNTGKAEAPPVQPEKDPGEHKGTAPDASHKPGAVKKAPVGSAAPEKKEPKKPAAAHPFPEGMPSRKAAAGAAPAEGKVSRKPAPGSNPAGGEAPGSVSGKAPGDGEASRKAAPAKAAGEGKAPRKPASQEASSERKVPRRSANETTSAEERTPRRSVNETASAEERTPRKSADGAAPAEARTPRKSADGAAPAEARTPRKAADGAAPAEARAARRAQAGGTSPEKRTRKPDGHKPSGEKAGTPRPASAKRPSAVASAEQASEKHPSGKPPVKKRAAGAPVNPAAEHSAEGAPKRKAVRKSMAESGEQRYGNIPPEKVRTKKEHAVRKGYEDMLSTDPNYKPVKKKRTLAEEEVQHVKKERPVPAKKRPDTKASLEDEYEEDDEADYDDTEYVTARFRVPRILFGIISVLAAGFFAYGGFFAGLENIASGSTVSTGTTFLIFAICMLVSGLMLLIMQNRNTILAFILPMIFYFGAAVFTFLKRGDDKMFLFCAIGGAVLGLIFLVLGIVSRNSDGYDDSDDYDDPFDDEYE